MGVLTNLAENGHDATVAFLPPFKGLYSHNTPTNIPDGLQPDLVNLDVPVGIPEVMAGSTLFAASMVLSGTPTMLGVWYASDGTTTYLGANTAGEVYYWTGSAWAYLRRGLSTSTTWWSQTKISTYLVMANKNDGQWKYDGTRLLPLGAKHIASMETTETWAGSGAADTTNVKQGIQGRKLTSTGAAVSTTYTPGTALDLTDAIGPTARDYTTSDLIHFWLYLDTAANLDTSTTYIRFGNSADTVYYQRLASGWGALANGWNEISIIKSTFTTAGAPNWNNIAKVTLVVDATGANTVNATFDDLYLQYAVTMPKCQVVIDFKNMLMGLNDTAGVSNVNYSRVSGPDDWDQLASFPVADGDGDTIVGGRPYFDQVIIGKEHSIHSIYVTVSNTTYPAYRFAQTPITYAYGLASHRSIVEAGMEDGVTRLYWWSLRDAVVYDGSSVSKLSLPIDPTMAGMEFTRLPFVVGARLTSENQVWWSYTPSGGSANTRLLRYDYAQGAWLPATGQTLSLLEAVTSGGKEVLLSVTAAGRVLQQSSGTAFDSADISASLDLPWVSGPNPEQMKRWQTLFVPLANGSGQVKINYRTADSVQHMASATYHTARTITLSAFGEGGHVDIGARSRWIQVQIINVNGAAFQLLSPITLRAVVLPQRY